MNNNQNEQAQVQQTNEQQVNQATNSKPKRKPLFQEGTILHTVFYRITERVQAGEISFAKVFWVGFAIIFALNILIVMVLGLSEITKEIVEIIGCMIWVRHLWFARKQVYHPAWFYIGMGIALFPILWFAIGFVKGFIPAFLAARRGY